MSLATAVATAVSVARQCANVIGMDIMLFLAAGVVYMFFVRGLTVQKHGKSKSPEPVHQSLPCTDRKVGDVHRLGDHRGVVRLWHRGGRARSSWPNDLSLVVDSLQKVGSSADEVVEEVRLAWDSCPDLLQAVMALPSVLSRQGSNTKVVQGIQNLIDEKAQSGDPQVLAEILDVHMRRRDYRAVSLLAERVTGVLTSEVRCTFAAAAANCGSLPEALGHLRLLPSPQVGHACPLTHTTVVTILGLAVEAEMITAAATELTRLQVSLDPSHMDSLVDSVAQRGGSQMIRDLVALCDALSADSTTPGRQTTEERHASSVVRGFARTGDLDSASSVLKRLKAGGRALSPVACNCLLEAFIGGGDIAGALRQFEEMREADCLDVVSYNTLLKAHLNNGQLDDAEKLMQEMCVRGVRPNRVAYNELLHARVQTKDVTGAWRMIDQMRSASIKVNAVTCAIWLKSLTVQSPKRDIQRVVDLVLETEVDDVLLSCVVEACNRLKHVEPLMQLLTRLPDLPSTISAPCFGAMIKSLGQVGELERVRDLWRQMFARGLHPGQVTFGCMAEALVMNGQPDEALKLIHDHVDSEDTGHCINTVIYTSVLKGFAMARRVKEVFSTYEEMKHRGIQPNTVTYNTMLDACAKCGAMDRASCLVEEMKHSAIELDIITYSTLVKGYCGEGHVDRALRVMEDMKRVESFAPDEIMYNSLLDGCAREQNADEGLRLLDEMRGARIVPSNYTLSIMVKLLGNTRRLNEAFRLFKDLSSQSAFRPNVQSYTSLTHACVANRRLDRALELHDKMVADLKCSIDDKFYSVLLRGCLQLRQFSTAVDVVRAAYQLPGGVLSSPPRAVGVEPRTLEECDRKFKAAGQEEQRAWSRLAADLVHHRGIDLHSLDSTMEGRCSREKGRGRGHQRH